MRHCRPGPLIRDASGLHPSSRILITISLPTDRCIAQIRISPSFPEFAHRVAKTLRASRDLPRRLTLLVQSRTQPEAIGARPQIGFHIGRGDAPNGKQAFVGG